MQIVTLQAHFDGKQILLDEPYELAPDTKLIVGVIQTQDEERGDWTRFSLANLERAYGDDEPEYSYAVSETALLSEAVLAEDWDRPEEDEAWSYL